MIATPGDLVKLRVVNNWAPADIPSFAVVGRVNMGKSAVLSTLLEIDDNELIRVSPTPGETTRCQIHRVVFSGRECLRFIDTPGFSQPIEAMRAIQHMHGVGTPMIETLRRFVARRETDFEDERRLLEPLLDGAGILYIVDPARPLRDDFLAEMEILRWTGRPRLALLNRHADSENPEVEEAWRSQLGAAFNLTRSFDAHQARYPERLKLLRSLLEIEERHHAALKETIRLVEDEWTQRREQSAEILLEYLETALGLRVASTLEEKDLTLPSRRERKKQLLAERYFRELRELEQRGTKQLLAVYRHHLLHQDSDPSGYAGLDLAHEETWSKWGLRRGQLTTAAALAGAAAGFGVDLATGGLTHGVGTAIGALTGATAAWFKGGTLPDLRLDLSGGINLKPGEGRELRLGPPNNPNFPWVLLDAMLVRYSQILERAHGRRDAQHLHAEGPGYTQSFPRHRREVLAKWFGSCLKGSPNRGIEPEVFEELVRCLAGIPANPDPA